MHGRNCVDIIICRPMLGGCIDFEIHAAQTPDSCATVGVERMLLEFRLPCLFPDATWLPCGRATDLLVTCCVQHYTAQQSGNSGS